MQGTAEGTKALLPANIKIANVPVPVGDVLLTVLATPPASSLDDAVSQLYAHVPGTPIDLGDAGETMPDECESECPSESSDVQLDSFCRLACCHRVNGDEQSRQGTCAAGASPRSAASLETKGLVEVARDDAGTVDAPNHVEHRRDDAIIMMRLRVAMPKSVMKPTSKAMLMMPPPMCTAVAPPTRASGRFAMTKSASFQDRNAVTSKTAIATSASKERPLPTRAVCIHWWSCIATVGNARDCGRHPTLRPRLPPRETACARTLR